MARRHTTVGGDNDFPSENLVLLHARWVAGFKLQALGDQAAGQVTARAGLGVNEPEVQRYVR
jgi:hypothetical protein